jgi:hypothetical protein
MLSASVRPAQALSGRRSVSTGRSMLAKTRARASSTEIRLMAGSPDARE